MLHSMILHSMIRPLRLGSDLVWVSSKQDRIRSVELGRGNVLVGVKTMSAACHSTTYNNWSVSLFISVIYIYIPTNLSERYPRNTADIMPVIEIETATAAFHDSPHTISYWKTQRHIHPNRGLYYIPYNGDWFLISICAIHPWSRSCMIRMVLHLAVLISQSWWSVLFMNSACRPGQGLIFKIDLLNTRLGIQVIVL